MRKKVLLYIAAMLSGFVYLQGLALAVSEVDTSKMFMQSSAYITTIEPEVNGDLLLSMGTYIPEYYSAGYGPLFNRSGWYVNVSYAIASQFVLPQQVSALYDPVSTDHYRALLETDFDDTSIESSSGDFSALPEPAIMMLIGIGMVCFAGYVRRRGDEKTGKDDNLVKSRESDGFVKS